MSSILLPSFAGLGFDIVRTPKWETTIQENISGKEVRIARQSSPRWQWDLTYNVLRSYSINNEFQQLVGFFNSRQGQFDTFLYQDVDDYTVTSQVIGVGDGNNTIFQLVRTFGAFVEPVLAPNVVSAVYLAGTVISSTLYTVTLWSSTNPGMIAFLTPPVNGAVITVDFTYYFPVRLLTDSLEFTMFLSNHYKLKKFSFISVKN